MAKTGQVVRLANILRKISAQFTKEKSEATKEKKRFPTKEKKQITKEKKQITKDFYKREKTRYSDERLRNAAAAAEITKEKSVRYKSNISEGQDQTCFLEATQTP